MLNPLVCTGRCSDPWAHNAALPISVLCVVRCFLQASCWRFAVVSLSSSRHSAGTIRLSLIASDQPCCNSREPWPDLKHKPSPTASSRTPEQELWLAKFSSQTLTACATATYMRLCQGRAALIFCQLPQTTAAAPHTDTGSTPSSVVLPV